MTMELKEHPRDSMSFIFLMQMISEIWQLVQPEYMISSNQYLESFPKAETEQIVKAKKLVKTLRIKFDSRNFENPCELDLWHC